MPAPLHRHVLNDKPRYFAKKPRHPERDAEIRARYEAGTETLRQIAADYRITAARVCMIARGRTGHYLAHRDEHMPRLVREEFRRG